MRRQRAPRIASGELRIAEQHASRRMRRIELRGALQALDGATWISKRQHRPSGEQVELDLMRLRDSGGTRPRLCRGILGAAAAGRLSV